MIEEHITDKPIIPLRKEPWRMTRKEFFANPPEEVDIWLVEGKPPHRGKIGSSPDFFGGPPTRGYRVANTVTPFDIAHKNIIKHALEEGKPVPSEVLADYPELAPKPWRMTQKQFENIKKKPVDLPIDELEPTHALDIEPGEPKTPKDIPIEVWQDIDTGKYLIEDGHNRVFHARRRGEKFIKAIVTPTKRIAEDEVVTAFDILHKEIIKQAIREGKPVPQEVLRDYPDLTGKVSSNHIIWESEHIT